MLIERQRRSILSLAILVAIVVGTGCDYNEEQEAGTQDDRQTAVVYPAGTTDLFAETPPGTDAEEPTDSVTIENGQFRTQEITLPTGEDVVLNIDNTDEQPYELRIENLTTVDFIAGGSLTIAELADPPPGTYEAVLSAPQSPDEIASFQLVITEE